MRDESQGAKNENHIEKHDVVASSWLLYPFVLFGQPDSNPARRNSEGIPKLQREQTALENGMSSRLAFGFVIVIPLICSRY